MFHVKHHSPFLHIAQKFRAKFFLFPVEISLICAILFSTILEWPGSSRSGRRRVSFLAKIIAIVNQKGGVGKTTTCVNLTAVLRERGQRVLLTMFDGRTNLAMQVAEEVKRYFPGKVYATVIPRNVRLSEAPSHGKPINAYDRSSRGAEAYGAFADEFLKKNG